MDLALDSPMWTHPSSASLLPSGLGTVRDPPPTSGRAPYVSYSVWSASYSGAFSK
jgi:hypothetical protein